MISKHLLGGLTFSVAAMGLVPAAHAALESDAVLKRAFAAMGDPKTLVYSAAGTGWTFGQAYLPGKAWPKIMVHSQTRTINYDTASMREDITISRAEPKGGGGYPLAGQQRNDQFVSGDLAWNMAGTNPQPGPRFTMDRVHQLWITPHGVLKAAAKNKATLDFTSKGGKSYATLKFKEPGRFTATAYLNDKFQVERVESRLPDPVLGEVDAVTVYSEYRAVGGVQFPGRVSQSQGGHPTLEVIVTDVKPGAPADISVPEAVSKYTERVAAEKVADGVWHIAGGSHNSVAIEMKDHMVLVETPLMDSRSAPVIEEAKKLGGGKKPVKFVINSHHHFDHTGGIRTAAAMGLTIVTQATNKAYFEQNLARKVSIAPDLLAKSGKKAKVVAVGEKMVMNDGSRTIELHRMKDSVHTETFLMVYLPKEKLLVEADAYTPLPPNAAPPSPPNANNVNMVENIERMKFAVDKILPLHGRVVSIDDLYKTASRKR